MLSAVVDIKNNTPMFNKLLLDIGCVERVSVILHERASCGGTFNLQYGWGVGGVGSANNENSQCSVLMCQS